MWWARCMARTPSLPEPPPKNSFRALPHKARVWYRVHPFDAATGKYGPAAFNDSGLGSVRFSPLRNPATGKPIATIYAGSSMNVAIMEVVLHNVPTSSTGYMHDLQRDYDANLFMSRVHMPELSLVNLTATGLKGSNLRVTNMFDGHERAYGRTQAWALWTWQKLPMCKGSNGCRNATTGTKSSCSSAIESGSGSRTTAIHYRSRPTSSRSSICSRRWALASP